MIQIEGVNEVGTPSDESFQSFDILERVNDLCTHSPHDLQRIWIETVPLLLFTERFQHFIYAFLFLLHIRMNV